MCWKNNHLLQVILVCCVVLGLLTALMPFSDIDNDGLPDSLITEGAILFPVLYTITGIVFLSSRHPAACIAAPQLFSSLLLPPPISN